jgi:DNA invertase Pin-like site-specific DNA recombinase
VAFAALRVLEPEFCTSTDTGRILVTVLGLVAEIERRFILERQRVAIDAAKKKGVYKGRKPSVPVEAVRKRRDDVKGPAEIAVDLGSASPSAISSVSKMEEGAWGETHPSAINFPSS